MAIIIADSESYNRYAYVRNNSMSMTEVAWFIWPSN
jgi:hypothetical protein